MFYIFISVLEASDIYTRYSAGFISKVPIYRCDNWRDRHLTFYLPATQHDQLCLFIADFLFEIYFLRFTVSKTRDSLLLVSESNSNFSWIILPNFYDYLFLRDSISVGPLMPPEQAHSPHWTDAMLLKLLTMMVVLTRGTILLYKLQLFIREKLLVYTLSKMENPIQGNHLNCKRYGVPHVGEKCAM